jgi:hypothetical protein
VKVADIASKLSDAFQHAATKHPGNGAEQWKAVAEEAVRALAPLTIVKRAALLKEIGVEASDVLYPLGKEPA